MLSKSLAICCVVSLSGWAFSSYELVIASDFASNTVRRFDGDSGIPLGSLGSGQVNQPGGIYADPSSGLVYSGNFGTGGMSVFNYSTGSFVSSFLTGITSLRGIRPCTAAGYAGQFLFTTSGAVYRGTMSASGFSPLASYVNGALNGNGAVQLSNGNVVTADSTGVIRIFNPAGTQLSVSSVMPGYVAGTDFVGTLEAVGSTFIVSSTNSATLGRINRATIVGTTVTWGATNTFVLPSGLTQIAGSTAGHGGRLYFSVGNVTVTNSQIIRYDTVLNTSTALTGTGVVGAFGLTSIVAPEPSSMLALALGGLALLSRRKR